MDTPTPVPLDELPTTIRAFLDAHAAGGTDAAARTFAETAVVVDEGRTYRGREQVIEFLRDAGSQFTYTTTLIGAEQIDDTRWVAVNRLEGDFPGGVAVLGYRFALAGDLIAELVIGD